jgi:hypothetical protein
MDSKEIRKIIEDALNEWCDGWVSAGVPFSHYIYESGGTVQIEVWPRDVSKVVILKQTSDDVLDSWKWILKTMLVSGIDHSYKSTISIARNFPTHFSDMDAVNNPSRYPLTPKDCFEVDQDGEVR